MAAFTRPQPHMVDMLAQSAHTTPAAHSHVLRGIKDWRVHMSLYPPLIPFEWVHTWWGLGGASVGVFAPHSHVMYLCLLCLTPCVFIVMH